MIPVRFHFISVKTDCHENFRLRRASSFLSSASNWQLSSRGLYSVRLGGGEPPTESSSKDPRDFRNRSSSSAEGSKSGAEEVEKKEEVEDE